MYFLLPLFEKQKAVGSKPTAILLVMLCYKRIAVNTFGNGGICLVSSDVDLIECAVFFLLVIVLALLNCAVN